MAVSQTGMTLAQFETLLNATDADFTPNKLAMTLNHKKYEVTNQILPRYKKTGSGTAYESHIQLEDSPNGGNVGMFFVQDNIQIYDTDQTITSNYRHYVNGCAYDEAQIDINRGDRVQRYNYMKSQRMAMHRKAADDIKEQWWSAPASASDGTSIRGPFGWLVQGDALDAGSFSGGDPYYLDGNTYNAGGLATGTYSKWKSYYADHNGVINDTILDIMGTANRKTGFEVPLVPNMQKINGVETNVANKVVYYTSDNVLKQIEKIARNSDDRIGYDLGKYAGETTYKGIPFRYNDIFDTASTYLYGTDPIVAINYNVLYPVVVRGWYFKKKIKENPFSHNAFNEFIDLYWCGAHCDNRQQCGYMINEHS
jgi:hypothetical protein